MGTIRAARLPVCVTLLAVGLAAEPPEERTLPQASIAGSALPGGLRLDVVVEQDLDLPDMAALTVGGRKGREFAGGVKAGDDVAVLTDPASPGPAIFKGEVVGIEPVVDPGGSSRVVIRAFNRLHRLTGPARTRDFFDTTDGEIVETIATENGLVPAASGEVDIKYDHVFQHNQTDLEFLRERAGRLGYEVWVEDTKLFFAAPPVFPPVAVARRPRHGEARLVKFHPRLASSETVQQVVVQGRDPEGHELVGKAAAPTILLQPGEPDPGLVLGRTLTFTVDHPISSVEEANAIAKAILEDRLLSFVTGEAQSVGRPELRPGRTVAIAGLDGRFDGSYYVAGARHTYSPGQLCGGYKTSLRLRRAPEAGLFFLPEIDDEVLLAFTRGDVSQPFVVGTLWDDDGGCAPDPPPRD